MYVTELRFIKPHKNLTRTIQAYGINASGNATKFPVLIELKFKPPAKIKLKLSAQYMNRRFSTNNINRQSQFQP